jgi:hypothetical protein
VARDERHALIQRRLSRGGADPAEARHSGMDPVDPSHGHAHPAEAHRRRATPSAECRTPTPARCLAPPPALNSNTGTMPMGIW